MDVETYIADQIFKAERKWYMNNPKRPKLYIYISVELEYEIRSVQGRTTDFIVDYQEMIQNGSELKLMGYTTYVVHDKNHPPMRIFNE